MAKKIGEDSREGDQSAHQVKMHKEVSVTLKPDNSDTQTDNPTSAERKRARKELKLAKRLAESRSLQNEANGVVQSSRTDETERELARKARKAEKKRLKKLRREQSTNDDRDVEMETDGQGIEERANTSTSLVQIQSRDSTSESEAVFERRSHVSSNTSRSSKEQSPTTERHYSQDPALDSLPQSEVDAYLSSNMISIERDQSCRHLRPVLQFSNLPHDTYKPLKELFQNFDRPTPIQSASWPFALSGHDVVGVAETGSGKTLAFGVPCLRHILSRNKKDSKRKGIRAVIVSPTRELAVQIHEQIESMASTAGIQATCVYGGVPKESQRAALKTSEIVVATPGRLNDLIDEGYAKLNKTTYLVLDEADRMLDKGFEDAIRKIISATAPHDGSTEDPRQTLMFTATWPPSVRELASTFMRKPVKINIGDSPTGELRANTRIKQMVEVIEPRMKEQRLLQLLKLHQHGKAAGDRILVFCLYKKEAARVEGSLRQRGVRVAGIHGDMSQDKRTSSLESFKSGKTPVLVATDVAARGLDIPAVKAVINVTFPLTTEDYVHRIGRTGRAGAEGLAITLFTEHDKAQSGALINVLKAAKQPVPEDLMKFGTTVKRKQHDAYGAFYKETDGMKKATKITFDE